MRVARSVIAACCFVFQLFGPGAYAEGRCQWPSWAEMAKTLGENSPELAVLHKEQDYRKSLADSSALRPSSTVDAQFAVGNKLSSGEASYLWTLERGDKRNARIEAVKAEGQVLEARWQDRKSQIYLELALAQQEFRRLEAKREVLLETKETYTAIIRQYGKLLTLGPEQEASLGVFKIAMKENDLRIEALSIDQARLSRRIAGLSGCSDLRVPPLAQKALVWPEFENRLTESSPGLKRLDAEAQQLKKSLQAEVSGLKQDMSIGPLLILEQDDKDSKVQAGVAFSMPLSSGREESLSTSRQAEFAVKEADNILQRNRMESERSAWLVQYQTSRKALKSGFSREELSRSHKKLEGLFRGERVSAALVIEAHRQMFEHTETYAEIEGRAFEALWNLKYLDGSLEWSDL